LTFIISILENPSEPKYRVVKRENKAISSKILLNGAPQGEALERVLIACGFKQDGSEYRYDDTRPTSQLQDDRDLIRAIIISLRPEEESSSRTPTTQASSAAHDSNGRPATTANRNNNIYKRRPLTNNDGTADIRALREEQAQKYRNREGEGEAPKEEAAPSSSVWSFFRNLTGGSEQEGPNRDQRERPRIKTISDLRTPPRRG